MSARPAWRQFRASRGWPLICIVTTLITSGSQGTTETTTSDTRAALADQVKQLAGQIVGIANTSAENGVLIYLSLLERRMEVIADRGILKCVPPLNWNHAVFEVKQLAKDAEPAKLIEGLRSLGKLLAEHMPATGENPNELADGPRIELK